MYFYDRASIASKFGAHAIVSEIDEPAGTGTLPFFNVVCSRRG